MTEPDFPVGWYVLTAGMILCITVSIACIIIQKYSIKWYDTTYMMCTDSSNVNLQRKTLFFVYAVYITSCICCIQCFLCHISDNFHPLFCEYGMAICVVFYVAAKSFLYGFFIERAKPIYAKEVVQSIIFQYLLPLYILVYFVAFAVLCMVYFRGKLYLTDDTQNGNEIPEGAKISACLFHEFKVWLFVLGAIVEGLNSLGLLYLFLKPLYRTLKTHEQFVRETELSQRHHGHHAATENTKDTAHAGHGNLRKDTDIVQMITAIKINLLCTGVATVSCIVFFLLMAFSRVLHIEHLLWFLGNMDLLINSISICLCLKPNRCYLCEKLCCGCFGWTCAKCLDCKPLCHGSTQNPPRFVHRATSESPNDASHPTRSNNV